MAVCRIQRIHRKNDDIRFRATLTNATDHNVHRGVVTEIATASVVQYRDLVG